ncbi:MAG: 4Fe-4S binding protein [Acidobacteria bacterium]|nr:4Fe-4S binding protein [Acidobacteriota bacterium]
MTEKLTKKHRRIQGLRISSQIFFFGLFVFLLLATHYSGEDSIGAVEGFFHFDPLIGLTASLASRTFLIASLWALATVAITAVFGRFVCGWVCPMGAALQFFSFLFKKARWNVPANEGVRLLCLKYAVLVLVLTAALFTLDIAGFFDPLSLLYRSFITAVLPVFVVSGDAAASILQDAGLASLGDYAQEILRNLTINRTFHQALFLGVIFLGILLLNGYRERFWCRYLCPAGALLAALSRWNLVKVKVDKDRCVQCGNCTLHCPTQANPYPDSDWQPRECIYCYTCSSECPTKAIQFPIRLSPVESKSIDFSRRRWIFSILIGVTMTPLFRISESNKRASDKRIRPPGALPEKRFLSLCTKCGECMKVCPTNALQPALNQAGPEGLWTPVLVPRIGYCEYYCSLCTQVCPTGAIKELGIREKVKVRIGSAWINKNRCIPYVLGEPCTVCEEQCPTSPKAIIFTEMDVSLPDGNWTIQEVPVVDPDICIGCGICETKCPVYDEPGIYCTSMGESRSI